MRRLIPILLLFLAGCSTGSKHEVVSAVESSPGNRAPAAWGLVSKSALCKNPHTLESGHNTFIGLRFFDGVEPVVRNYYTKIANGVVTDYYKSLCDDPKAAGAGGMLMMAQTYCRNACDKGSQSPAYQMPCKKYCDRAYEEGTLFLEGYGMAVRDLTGDPGAESCSSGSAARKSQGGGNF